MIDLLCAAKRDFRTKYDK